MKCLAMDCAIIFLCGCTFISQKLNQDLSVGFGMLSYFGLRASYDDGWVGRYYVQKATLLGMTLMPALSYRVTAGFLSVRAST